MIERYDPFGRMMSLRQMMDRLMEDAFIMPRGSQAAGAEGSTMSAALNIFEEGDDVVVEASLPGMRPEDIDITVERGTLVIRGETKADEERKERNYIVREHRQGSFMRSIRLPETADPDACQASFENGILRLTFPKSQQARPRRIHVSGAGGQSAMPAGSQGSAGGGMSSGSQGGTTSRPQGTDGASAGATGGGQQTQTGRTSMGA
jgi:HSP20 family protein